ncbi:aminoglycoside 3-N-acetyltransferase [Streptomyces sp. CZ24]|nr:AAC(3) family N-acetyltransferase [Streptomyces sp. CZ24]MDH6191974.1 aminoglycoside 3-N-acetyltransferase [Streptomyces sp. CZ24]
MSSPAPVTGPLNTRASLAAALRDLGVRPGETLLAHTSLSSLGRAGGGAVAPVQALLDALGEDGTLAVPRIPATTPARRAGATRPSPSPGGPRSARPCRRTTAHHPEPRRRRRPGDRPHLARRPAQHPPADLLRRPYFLGAGLDDRDRHLGQRRGVRRAGGRLRADHPVVRGTAGGATARLFPLAAAVAHAERWLPVHRPRAA